MYKNVKSNIIQDSPKLETNQMYIKMEYINRSLYSNMMVNYIAIRMNTLQLHGVTWIDFTYIILSKRCDTQKKKNTQQNYSTYTKFKNRQSYNVIQK